MTNEAVSPAVSLKSKPTSSPSAQSHHPDVQELIARFDAHQEMDCPALDGGYLDFIGAIYMEAAHDPEFHPTPEILGLIRTVNAQMRLCSMREVA